MITPEKIEEWAREAEERPSSAPLLVRHLAGRLRELSRYNEELQADNLALISEKRVEELQQRIAHLEYQLDLLKRGGVTPAQPAPAGSSDSPTAVSAPPSLLIYTSQGRVLRFSIPESESEMGQISGDLQRSGEAPRLLAVAPREELLFVFSSGRVATLPAEAIPAAQPDGSGRIPLAQAPIPHEPHSGETLACLAPVAKMALAEAFVQVSRRGFTKKIANNLLASILSNHSIGAGVRLPADRTFSLSLCQKEDRLALVSREGYLICFDLKTIPYSIEEAMRLGVTDSLVDAFVAGKDSQLVVMTQPGKLLHRQSASQESAQSLRTRGQALLSPARREQGVRVIGGGAARETGWAVALHSDGRLQCASLRLLLDAGALKTSGELVGFCVWD